MRGPGPQIRSMSPVGLSQYIFQVTFLQIVMGVVLTPMGWNITSECNGEEFYSIVKLIFLEFSRE